MIFYKEKCIHIFITLLLIHVGLHLDLLPVCIFNEMFGMGKFDIQKSALVGIPITKHYFLLALYKLIYEINFTGIDQYYVWNMSSLLDIHLSFSYSSEAIQQMFHRFQCSFHEILLEVVPRFHEKEI